MDDDDNAAAGTWSSQARALWDAEGLALLLENSADIIAVLDQNGLIRFANPSGQELLGHRTGSLLGADAFALIHDDDQADARGAFAEILLTPEQVGPVRLRLRTESGQWRHAELVARNLLHEPAVAGVVLNVRDVTDRVTAEEAMRDSERRFRDIADHVPDLIFRYRAGESAGFEYLSPAVEHITGYVPEDLYAKPELLSLLLDPELLARISAMDHAALLEPIEFDIRRADGTDVWVQLRLTVHRRHDGAVDVIDGIVRDMSQRKRAENQLIRQALHDPLTGLPNRVLFYDRLNHALDRADRLPSSPAVLFLDLDEFKAVNDRHGHAAGDEVLRVVAARLTAAVRPGDTVARLGGDEFLVLCDDITGDLQLDTIRHRISDAIAEPISLGEASVAIEVSIGATRAGEHAGADELLRLADEAMYLDKEQHHATGVRRQFATRDPSPTARRRRTDIPRHEP